MKIAFVINWILWSLLFLTWPMDMLVAFLQEQEPAPVDTALAGMFGFFAFISVSLTFALKWFLFRFLINPNRIPITSPWAIAIFIIGCLMIWGLTKSIETYGFIIFLSSGSMSHYLAFWLPALAVMILHMPFLLDPRRAQEYSVRQK